MHYPSGPTPPGWPRFGVDHEGEVVTAPALMASSIKLLATYPGDVDWTFAEHQRTWDETSLAQGLASWPEFGPARGDMERGPASPETDQIGIEEAAFASLDPNVRDDGWDDDPDSGLDGTDHDDDAEIDFGSDEAETDHYNPE